MPNNTNKPPEFVITNRISSRELTSFRFKVALPVNGFFFKDYMAP